MNKLAVVTGGASGIGQAVAERLARNNFIVTILDIAEEGGKQVADRLQGDGKQATFIALDVTREADVQKTFQRINIRSWPYRCPRQRRRWQLASTQNRRVSLGPLASCYRCQFDLHLSLLPGSYPYNEESEERGDCEYLLRHRFQWRCGTLSIRGGKGRDCGILKNISPRACAL